MQNPDTDPDTGKEVRNRNLCALLRGPIFLHQYGQFKYGTVPPVILFQPIATLPRYKSRYYGYFSNLEKKSKRIKNLIKITPIPERLFKTKKCGKESTQ
jgi:hypothetical protein